MRALVLGSLGQLGAELRRAGAGRTVITHTRFDADILDAPGLARFVREARPDWVLNTVAFNRTEFCEEDPGLAWAVNSLAPRALAALCADIGARLLHFSTDFVFDGAKGVPYVESDAAGPLNVYGVSKFAGERFVLAASGKNIVVRTASLFGVAGSRAKGGNFVEAILSQGKSGKPLKVVSDIVMSPTSALDLAEKVWRLADRDPPGGVYHLVNAGQASWHEFAKEILERAGLGAAVEPVSSSAQPGRMRRPVHTPLSSERLPALGLQPLRPWREALADYLRERNETNQ
jgi:dTDP-4-dehydrorhamnose reductase